MFRLWLLSCVFAKASWPLPRVARSAVASRGGRCRAARNSGPLLSRERGVGGTFGVVGAEVTVGGVGDFPPCVGGGWFDSGRPLGQRQAFVVRGAYTPRSGLLNPLLPKGEGGLLVARGA